MLTEGFAVKHQILSIPEVSSLSCFSASLVCEGGPFKPDIIRLDFGDGREPMVFKTFALKNFWVGATLGWFVTWREYRMLRRLRGIDGICQLVRDSFRWGIFLKWIPGAPLHRFRKNELPSDVYQRVVRIVKKMHEAGVVHLDLGHCGNILVTPDKQPVLVDFQSAFFVKRWPPLFRRWLERIDELTVLKWKKKRFPKCLTVEDLVDYRYRKKIAHLWPFG